MSNCAFCEKEKEIYGYCAKCGAPLCEECYNFTDEHYCYECSQTVISAAHEAKKKEGWIYIVLAILWIISFGSFFACFYIYGKYHKTWIPFIGIGIVFLFCFYPSWKIVREKFQRTGWIIFIIKFILSVILMALTLPIYILFAVNSFVEAKKFSKLYLNFYSFKHKNNQL